MNIRRATPSDAESLYDLYQNHLIRPNSLEKTPQMPQDMDSWRKKITGFAKNPGYHILIGELDNIAISSVTLIIIENLTRNGSPYALIENVVTHEDFRGRGYAALLMEHAEGIAAEAGCYKIMLLTGAKKESTLAFYERCGFNRKDKTGFIKWL